VVLFLPADGGSDKPTELHNAREAITAMTKQGLGGYDMRDHLWSNAFTLLTRAVLDPSAQNLGAARIAVEVLGSRRQTRH
jgi:hypothetical protein